ncbi:MAG TPA: ATP cone domain-containing protein, partial [Spirochaetia bacterium]|nr:ATP cone domain-containing protein [Spirochaetia bacterium]
MNVRKRDGRIVEFESRRIANAVEKAFRAAGQAADDQLDEVVARILTEIEEAHHERSPGVEDIQYTVERVLVACGLYEVSKRYILYREERARHRRERHNDILKRASLGDISVVKRDGRGEPFDAGKILATIDRLAGGSGSSIDTDVLLKELARNMFDGISTSDLEQALLLAITSFIERDPAYEQLSSGLYRQRLYREVLGSSSDEATVADLYRRAFRRGIVLGVEEGLFSSDLLDYDIDALAEGIRLERDDLLGYLGIQTLYERYFVRTGGHVIETPQAFWMRVAMGLALNEEERNARALEFYNVLSTLRFVASTPTLFHSGLTHPQLSSCYLSTIGDDLAHIFKCIGDNAQMSKWSGGIGNDWTSIRGTGAQIHSTHVESQGVIPFLKIANDTTVAINRSGKRRGA